MGINFFWKNNSLKNERMDYVKQFKTKGDVKIEPCTKFVACLDKLSKNYVLALRDNASIETLQIANQNDIEFFEGYEIFQNYTDDLRKKLCRKLCNAYSMIESTKNIIDKILHITHNDNTVALNDIKVEFSVISRIILNICQHVTMTNDIPDSEFFENDTNSLKDLLNILKSYVLQLVGLLIDINSALIIDYISKQLQTTIDKVQHCYDIIVDIVK